MASRARACISTCSWIKASVHSRARVCILHADCKCQLQLHACSKVQDLLPVRVRYLSIPIEPFSATCKKANDYRYRRLSPKLPPSPARARMSSRKQRGGSKRGPSTVEEPGFGNNRQKLKEVPRMKMDFTIPESFSPANAKYSSTKSTVPPVDVKIIVASEHLAFMIPAFNQDGWVDNLNMAIAVAKNVGMVGFKLAMYVRLYL
eukprot:COSAG05_NODE_847_length_6998_cov_1.434121_6_plen_204_part_00